MFLHLHLVFWLIFLFHRNECQKQLIFKFYNKCWLDILCCANKAVVKEFLKNDALVSKKKPKKCSTFVRQCWYIIAPWIYRCFQRNFLYVTKRYKMSALSKTKWKKCQYSPLYDHYLSVTKIHITTNNKCYNLVSCVFFIYSMLYSACVPYIISTWIILYQNSLISAYSSLFWYQKPTRYDTLWMLGFWIVFCFFNIFWQHLIFDCE